MKPRPVHISEAFTRIEAVVVILVLIVVLAVLRMTVRPMIDRASLPPRISCLNNLLQIGTAYRIWENDNGNRYPALQSVTKGGWSDLLTNADQGSLCWTNYAIMANELGQTPKLLVCPSDERKPAGYLTNASSIGTDLKDNRSLSYFVGVSACASQPQFLLGGDRNLGGTKPDADYGFSPQNGKGNDVAIQTNSSAAPVCWSLKMHSAGNPDGGGNILLGDGSARKVSTRSFRSDWLSRADPTTNWPVGHVPSSPYIRVLFP
jgi:type II secretory pathway pseudopilin PulG